MVFWLVFAIFLFVACAVLLVIEVFVPSFGMLTLFALGCLAGGLWIFFNHGEVTGWVGVAIAVVTIPVVWFITYKRFPKSRFGKVVTLKGPKRAAGDAIADSPELKEMLKKEGVVISSLRPVGMCDLSGERVECVAESGYVDKGKKIKVIHVEGTQLTVRVVEDN